MSNKENVHGIVLVLSLLLSGVSVQANSVVFQDTFSEAPHAVAPGSGINANWTPSEGATAGGRWEVSQGQAPAGAGKADYLPSGPLYGAQYVASIDLGSVTNWIVSMDVQDNYMGGYPNTSAGQAALLANWNGGSLGLGGGAVGATGLELVINPSFTGSPTLGGGTMSMFFRELVGGVVTANFWTQPLPIGTDGLPEGIWETLSITRDGNQVKASALGVSSPWFTTSLPNTGYAGQAYGYIYSFSGQDGLAFDNFTITQIPEPGAVALLASGGLLLWRRRKQ